MKTALDILKPRMEAAQAHKAAREEAAKRNRELMPGTAANMDEFSKIFGDGIKLMWAVENGRAVGRVPYDVVKDGI